MQALCEIDGIRYSIVKPQEAGGAISLMQSREGRRTLDVVRGYRKALLLPAVLARWLRARLRAQPANPAWQDLCAAADDLMLAFPQTSLPVREVVDWLYESSGAARRDGSVDALRLMTAHRAKGLEFRHVIVMDCGDWNRSEDERRLLYVSMTRAKETLTLFRADTSSNPFLADLDALESTVTLAPEIPRARRDLRTRYRSLSPADVDIGFAGRYPGEHRVHRDIARVVPGDRVEIRDRELVAPDGRVVGQLSKNTSLPDGHYAAKVTGVMIRAREQTAPAYLDSVRADRWEVLLVEAVEPPVEPDRLP